MHDSARGTKRKRGSRDAADSVLTMGEALAIANQDKTEDFPAMDITAAPMDSNDGATKRQHPADWQEVDRKTRKKQKKLEHNYPVLTHSAAARLQSFVKLSDIQSLVLYILADGTAPQWVSARHHQNFDKVVVLMVPGLDTDLFNGAVSLDETKEELGASVPNGAADKGNEPASDQASTAVAGTEAPSTTQQSPQKMKISPDDFWPSKLATQKLAPALQPLCEIFSHIWPIKAPGEFKRIHSPVSALLSSPIPRPKEDKNIKGPKPPVEGRGWTNKRTPITEYIATKSDLAENAYALHPAHLHSDAERDAEKARRFKAVQTTEDGWIDLLDIQSLDEGAAADADIEAGSILQGRRLLVIDCEMVTTTVDRFALARVSIIDWDGTLVLDSLVKPADPVKDYLTPYSGITQAMLGPCTTTLADIQARLRALVTPQTILAGHSLDSDLRALKLSYPFIIDTSLLYPHPKGPPQKSSLKWLSQKYLSREIQSAAAAGHDSVEDALACLDLIKQKCDRGKTWGTPAASAESIFKRLARTGRLDPRGEKPADDKPRRTGALVDRAASTHGFAASAGMVVTCASDADVVAGVARAVADSEEIPGGADFVFARLRDLEYRRGWSTGPEVTHDQPLAEAVQRTVADIAQIWDVLPPRTGFVVLSGTGPPGDMLHMQRLYAQHKEEFLVKKWDELSVKWTDVEEQKLRQGVERAKRGVGFIAVK